MSNNHEISPELPANKEVGQMKYLARLNEVTEEDLQMLRAKVLPNQIHNFEKNISADDKVILALLFKLSVEELKDIIREQLKAGRLLLGMHKLADRLLVLSQATGDSSYYNYYKEVSAEQ